jgi:hypothetical protein
MWRAGMKIPRVRNEMPPKGNEKTLRKGMKNVQGKNEKIQGQGMKNVEGRNEKA